MAYAIYPACCPTLLHLVAAARVRRRVGPAPLDAGPTIEGAPDIPMFRQNTAAFIHPLSDDAISNVEGDSAGVRVQVLTNAGALDREKQLAVVSQFTELVRAATTGAAAARHIWVLLTEANDGGWGLNGHAHTNAELVQAARAQTAELSGNAS
jgi:phenylpyruvate tautomerase PptA (4-oxalocrotonate tautomerase family)